MSDISSSITGKLGPLPGYAWVGLAVGGVLIYKRLKGGSSSPSPVSTSSPDEGTSTSATPQSAAADSSQQPQSAQDWALAAAQHLGATTPYTPGQISTALSNYASGASLSPTEQSIVNQAITAQGFPPSGLLPVVPNANDYTPPSPQSPGNTLPQFENLPYIVPSSQPQSIPIYQHQYSIGDEIITYTSSNPVPTIPNQPGSGNYLPAPTQAPSSPTYSVPVTPYKPPLAPTPAQAPAPSSTTRTSVLSGGAARGD